MREGGRRFAAAMWMAMCACSTSAFSPAASAPELHRACSLLLHKRAGRTCTRVVSLIQRMQAAEEGGSGVQRKESVLFDEFCSRLPRMDGKIVAMTGCSSGLGFVAAKQVLTLGATLVMLNRPSIKANVALDALRAEIDYKLPQLDTPETADIEARIAAQMAEMRVIPVACDLLDLSSVRQAYVELRTKFPAGIDVLCLNAGVAAPPLAYQGEYDGVMLTNHLSNFLLVQLLLESLQGRASTTGEARIVSVTSEARKFPATALNLHTLSPRRKEEDSSSFDAQWRRIAEIDELYHQSKLAVAIFAHELSVRLRSEGSKVKSVLTHPGLATTQMASFVSAAAQSEEDGAMSLLAGICHEGVQCGDFLGPQGMKGCVEKLAYEPFIKDPHCGRLLWEASREATQGFLRGA